MQVTYEDLDILFEIQRIDLDVMHIKKTRASLPQRIQVVKIRKKREEIQPKLEQLVELEQTTQAKVTKIEDEDRSLAQKQERAQEIITAAGSDFRKVESHSKDMAGVAKRRVTLEENLLKLTEELDKIKAIRKQLEDAIMACDTDEERLRTSYQSEDNELIEKARALLREREGLAIKIPPTLMAQYDRTAKKNGGVALGKLEENGSCSVCRSMITGGRLIELNSQAPLGTCPNCKRLLVIEK